jgi:hypothetical protein
MCSPLFHVPYVDPALKVATDHKLNWLCSLWCLYPQMGHVPYVTLALYVAHPPVSDDAPIKGLQLLPYTPVDSRGAIAEGNTVYYGCTDPLVRRTFLAGKIMPSF